MKLLRYGPAGKEKPGLLDDAGVLRDLSGVLPDIGPAQLGDAALARLRRLKTAALPAVRGSRIGCPVAGVGSSSPSASTTLTTPPNPVCRCPRSRDLQQGDLLHPGSG